MANQIGRASPGISWFWGKMLKKKQDFWEKTTDTNMISHDIIYLLCIAPLRLCESYIKYSVDQHFIQSILQHSFNVMIELIPHPSYVARPSRHQTGLSTGVFRRVPPHRPSIPHNFHFTLLTVFVLFFFQTV